jgi:hypothetical protein
VIGGIFGNDTGMTGDKTMTGAQALLLCAMLAVAACNRDSGSTPAPNPVPHIKPKAAAPTAPATAAEQTAGMVEAASQGKSLVPVELKFDIAQRPKVGQPLDIDLALIAQIPASLATIQVSGADDVSVAPGATQFDIASEEAGEVYKHTVNVTPNAEGVVLLGVTVLLKHDEVVDQRVFSIPIIAER